MEMAVTVVPGQSSIDGSARLETFGRWRGRGRETRAQRGCTFAERRSTMGRWR